MLAGHGCSSKFLRWAVGCDQPAVLSSKLMGLSPDSTSAVNSALGIVTLGNGFADRGLIVVGGVHLRSFQILRVIRRPQNAAAACFTVVTVTLCLPSNAPLRSVKINSY